MSWSREQPNPCVPDRLKSICKLHVAAAVATGCRAGCTYCSLKSAHAWYRKCRWWTNTEAIEGFAALAGQCGPAFLLISGLEPLDDLSLISGLLRYHYAQTCTNLMVDIDELLLHVPVDRLELHPTFHPHLWDDIGVFLGKVRSAIRHGYAVPLVACVGHPLHLPHWDEWRKQIEDLGVAANFVPMRAAEYGGRRFPDEYTAEEKEVLARHMSGNYWDEGGKLKPLHISACAAGLAYLCVWPTGDVCRCGQLPGSMGFNNLFRDKHIELLREPAPCDQVVCRCTNLWVYHVE